jgi:NDP-sugar pyrophosphorylase family protein
LKAVVFAAGYGRRLYPLTTSRPKHLLPLAGKPLLLRVIESLRLAGVQELGVTVGYMADRVAELVTRLGGTPIWQKQITGTGQALKESKPFLRGEDRFFVVYGDVTVTSNKLLMLSRYVEENNLDGALIAVRRRGGGLYGVVKSKDGILSSIAEKSPEPGPVNSGVYILPQEIMDLVEGLGKSLRGEYELTDAVNMLAAKGRQIGVLIDEGTWWYDVGRPSDYFAANLFYIRNDLGERLGFYNAIEVGNHVTFRGPVIIGGNTRIGEGSILEGPLVIGEESDIGPNTYIAQSVLLEQVAISHRCRIKNSLICERTAIGEGVEVLADELPSLVTGPGAQLSNHLRIYNTTVI